MSLQGSVIYPYPNHYKIGKPSFELRGIVFLAVSVSSAQDVVLKTHFLNHIYKYTKFQILMCLEEFFKERSRNDFAGVP